MSDDSADPEMEELIRKNEQPRETTIIPCVVCGKEFEFDGRLACTRCRGDRTRRSGIRVSVTTYTLWPRA